MEDGSGNDLYQVLGEVNGLEEAKELVREYLSGAFSGNHEDAQVPANTLVIVRRNEHGYYTRREEFSL